MKKRKGVYVTTALPKSKVRYLQSYYFQGGKWKKVKRIKGTVNCPTL